MFDVPVPDVSVSAVPVLMDSVGQARPVGLSHASSTLLNAMAVSSQSVSVMSNTKKQPVPSTDSAASKALLPDSFQLLEPLNLAAMAVSLETLFTLSLEPASDSRLSASILSIGAIPASVTPKLSTDAIGQDSLAATPHGSVTSALRKVSPVPVRDELSRCVEAEKPQYMPQLDILFQVLLRGTVIGDIRGTHGPEYVVQALQEMLIDEPFNPNDIVPVLGEDKRPAIRLSQDVLVSLVSEDSAQLAMNSESEWAAITWSDQLRQIMGATPLDAGDIQMMLKGLHASEQHLNGLASWYGPYFHGRLTANGETFDQNTLTAAHKSLPFNTLLQVRNLKNDRTVVVRINDRGPYVGKRSLDLSKAAAHCLGSEQTGVIPYEAVILEPPITSVSSEN